MSGWKFPRPEYTPAADAIRVAEWLGDQVGGAVCLTTPSAAVRTCAVATERGLDISGTLFVLVGEPFTEAKAGVIAAAGCRAATHYAMVEAGMIGLACHAPTQPDDVHLVSDKIATIQVHRGGDNGAARALMHTSLLAAAPKVMLNVESGDAGVIEERDCGCGVLPASYRRHLHTIRSYEKLTSEGMHFVGARLITLVEEVLVRRYGGRPTDWQFVEQEESGMPKVSLVASPSIGALDDRDVVRTALEYLGQRGAGERLMSEVWENGETLRVVRAEPHVTAAGKVQALQKL
jgi:phenylacetate-coenzyme A ligase PaaK-like adenylate-forming protein